MSVEIEVVMEAAQRARVANVDNLQRDFPALSYLLGERQRGLDRYNIADIIANASTNKNVSYMLKAPLRVVAPAAISEADYTGTTLCEGGDDLAGVEFFERFRSSDPEKVKLDNATCKEFSHRQALENRLAALMKGAAQRVEMQLRKLIANSGGELPRLAAVTPRPKWEDLPLWFTSTNGNNVINNRGEAILMRDMAGVMMGRYYVAGGHDAKVWHLRRIAQKAVAAAGNPADGLIDYDPIAFIDIPNIKALTGEDKPIIFIPEGALGLQLFPTYTEEFGESMEDDAHTKTVIPNPFAIDGSEFNLSIVRESCNRDGSQWLFDMFVHYLFIAPPQCDKIYAPCLAGTNGILSYNIVCSNDNNCTDIDELCSRETIDNPTVPCATNTTDCNGLKCIAQIEVDDKGSTTELTASLVAGDGVSYQWFKDGVAGATTQKITADNSADAGVTFTVVIFAEGCTATASYTMPL